MLKSLKNIAKKVRTNSSKKISEGHLTLLWDKISEVPVKVKDVFEIRDLNYLSAQMKQSLIDRTIDNIRGLHELKSSGNKVGKLKFKSEVRSIPLKQYGRTYEILDNNHIRIEKIKQKIRVRGLNQIPTGSDIANGTLICKHCDYYLAITTYQTRKKEIVPRGQIGIDFGLARQLTLTSGIGIQYSIPVTNRLRMLYRQMSKQKERSKNWNKTRIKIDKEYSPPIFVKCLCFIIEPRPEYPKAKFFVA